MNTLPERIQNKIESMAAEFAAALPGRVEQIKELVLKDLESNKNNVEALHLAVHKLAGAGSTFGFPALTKISKEVEFSLYTVMEEGSGVGDGFKKKLVDYIAELEKICEHSSKKMNGSKGKIDNDSLTYLPVVEASVDKLTNAIYLFDSGNRILTELKEQLEIFGFNILILNSFTELREITCSGNTLLLISMDVFSLFKEAEKEFNDAKERTDGCLKYIFVSEKNNFDIRLQAVRAGGNDFFLFPVEIGRLIDSIDKLTERLEQEPYHVLIVDDDPEQVSYYAHVLQQAGMITSVATDPRQVVKVMVESKPEIILMDVYMPGCSGRELSAVIRQQQAFLSIPIIFLSVERSVDVQMETLKSGGDDFLMKPIKVDHLISYITNRVERSRGMRYFMERDSLTGLLNHSNLKEHLSREIMRSTRTLAGICFAMIDLDHFKTVNDTYGHLTGDNVLKALARLLNERLRKTDIIGRYGGEEFGAILINTDLSNARRIIDEIRENFSQMKQYSDSSEFYVTFSCGIASYNDYNTATELNEAADRALYQAKELGRNRVVLAQGGQ